MRRGAISRPQREAHSAGSMGTLGFPRPVCSQSSLERLCVSFPGHGKASRGHCDEGVMAPGVLRHSLPQSQALGSLGALPLLLLSPGAEAEPPPVRFQEKWIWMQSWEPASKILPFTTKPSVRKCSSLIIKFDV